MKSEVIYKIGLTAMCLVTAFIVIASAVAFSMWEEFGEEVDILDASFPLIGLVVTPIVGIVYYTKKKPLGWRLCCGYTIFLFAVLFLYYCGLRRLEGLTMEEINELTISFVVAGAVLVAVIILLLTNKMRTIFFPSEQDKFSDALALAILAAIVIAVIAFIPKLVGLIKSHYIVLFILAALFVLKWVINHK